jgi:hypothetical protein
VSRLVSLPLLSRRVSSLSLLSPISSLFSHAPEGGREVRLGDVGDLATLPHTAYLLLILALVFRLVD